MPEQQLFEYAVIRIVPQVEREEFINAGVVVYCARQKFLKAKITNIPTRLEAFAPLCDTEALLDHLRAFELICAGGKNSGTIGQLTIAERFRWLTATRSTLVQTSKVHPGFCDDADKMLEELFVKMVEPAC